MEIKEGDLFIYKSKYGGITRGVVSAIHCINVIDSVLELVYKDCVILSENKIPYKLEEIILVERYLTPEEASRFRRIYESVNSRKAYLNSNAYIKDVQDNFVDILKSRKNDSVQD